MERPSAAFALTLIAGIWILAMAVSWWAWGSHPGPGPGMMGGWMSGRGVLGHGSAWMMWVGVVSGLVILSGAIGLYVRPSAAPVWGVVIVAAAAANLFVGFGGFLASILGVVGGTLAAGHRTDSG